MFSKILIANRGEIACRIIHTARRLGIHTVAVYSDADRDALHVQQADEAVRIGPAAAALSYLSVPALLEACQRSGAQAVHPGYGFLSENAEFARALAQAGLTFIGPTAASIAALGDKIASRKLAEQAGVNVIPGHNDVIADPDEAETIAARIGYPVMIKASAGGGGKGLRVAYDVQEVREGWVSCRNEAKKAFNDDRVFIEKFIERPRHIEIQILGDAHGQVVYLGERECSLQRRHQKVIEEAPSVFVDEPLRSAMGEQAVLLARAVGYQSAGTVEFVVGADRQFYFLEMNTRLQVEHPVTELTTGLDLVEQMIRIAAGERLAFTQADLTRRGHALECRINAEDATRHFLPSVGRLTRFLPPPPSDHVRIDTGVAEGSTISPHYDSMIAKLITFGANRDEAIRHMQTAIDAFVIRGVVANVPFLSSLLRRPEFVAGTFTTGFIAEHYPQGLTQHDPPHAVRDLLLAVAGVIHHRLEERAGYAAGQDFVAIAHDTPHPLHVDRHHSGHRVTLRTALYEIGSDWQFHQPVFAGDINGQQHAIQVERIGLRYRLCTQGVVLEVAVLSPRAARALQHMPKKTQTEATKTLHSPMPGLLANVWVRVGQVVRAGERLATIEAMKMENVLRADQDGTIADILAHAGDSVAVDQPLLRFE